MTDKRKRREDLELVDLEKGDETVSGERVHDCRPVCPCVCVCVCVRCESTARDWQCIRAAFKTLQKTIDFESPSSRLLAQWRWSGVVAAAAAAATVSHGGRKMLTHSLTGGRGGGEIFTAF